MRRGRVGALLLPRMAQITRMKKTFQRKVAKGKDAKPQPEMNLPQRITKIAKEKTTHPSHRGKIFLLPR
jgi:hypothetical protein